MPHLLEGEDEMMYRVTDNNMGDSYSDTGSIIIRKLSNQDSQYSSSMGTDVIR